MNNLARDVVTLVLHCLLLVLYGIHQIFGAVQGV